MAGTNLKTKKIVIDADKGLIFDSEEELYQHFRSEVDALEGEFFKLRSSQVDIAEEELAKYEENLTPTLEDPDEIWRDPTTIPGVELTTFIKEFSDDEGAQPLFHVAIAYLTYKTPSFIYLHFPTQSVDLVERYQRGENIFDRAMSEAPLGSIDGDALVERDPLAIGMYEAMLKVRSEEDISESKFRDYASLREPTIEEADEIWRSNDSFGNVIVNFIKDFPDQGEKGVSYIVSTIEDAPSNSHALLFSFPTNDKSLVTRYRQGENLQAEEVVQESSH